MLVVRVLKCAVSRCTLVLTEVFAELGARRQLCIESAQAELHDKRSFNDVVADAQALESPLGDGDPRLLHQPEVVADIVDRRKGKPGYLVDVEEVPEVGAGIGCAGFAITFRVDWI